MGLFLWASNIDVVDFFVLHLVLASRHGPWHHGSSVPRVEKTGCHISGSRFTLNEIMVHTRCSSDMWRETFRLGLSIYFFLKRKEVYTSLLLSFCSASIPLDSFCPGRKNDFTMLPLKLGRVFCLYLFLSTWGWSAESRMVILCDWIATLFLISGHDRPVL